LTDSERLTRKKKLDERGEKISYKTILIIRQKTQEMNQRLKDPILKMMRKLSYTCNLDERMASYKGLKMRNLKTLQWNTMKRRSNIIWRRKMKSCMKEFIKSLKER
jgi:hypothetical protein